MRRRIAAAAFVVALTSVGATAFAQTTTTTAPRCPPGDIVSGQACGTIDRTAAPTTTAVPPATPVRSSVRLTG